MRIQREEKGTVVAEKEIEENGGAEEEKPEVRPRAHLLHSALASPFAPLSALLDLPSWNLQSFLFNVTFSCTFSSSSPLPALVSFSHVT